MGVFDPQIVMSCSLTFSSTWKTRLSERITGLTNDVSILIFYMNQLKNSIGALKACSWWFWTMLSLYRNGWSFFQRTHWTELFGRLWRIYTAFEEVLGCLLKRSDMLRSSLDVIEGVSDPLWIATVLWWQRFWTHCRTELRKNLKKQ